DEVRVPTHELNWFLEDFSAQRNIALLDRLHGPLNQRVHEFIVVQFPEGSILHSWEVGINGRFVNGGSDVCLGSGIDETGPVTSSCWDVDSGGKIADIPQMGDSRSCLQRMRLGSSCRISGGSATSYSMGAEKSFGDESFGITQPEKNWLHGVLRFKPTMMLGYTN